MINKETDGRVRYAIVNAQGLYSQGGDKPFVSFKFAKLWKTLGQVKQHLNLFVSFDGQLHVPDDWYVCRLVLIESSETLNAKEWFENHYRVKQIKLDQIRKQELQKKKVWLESEIDRMSNELKQL